MTREENETILIKSLYQSALSADHWSVALNRLCRYCGAEAGKLLMMDASTSLVHFYAQVGIPVRFHESGEIFIHCIPVPPAQHCSNGNALPGTYNWFFLKPSGCHAEEWIRVLLTDLSSQVKAIRGESSQAWLVLQNPSLSGRDFAWIDSGLINFLHFHVRLAVLLFGKNHDSQAINPMEPEILNRLKMGITCVNGQGLIAYYNNAFAELLHEGDGLYILNDRLSTHPDTQCFLLADIGEAAMKKNLAGIRIIERPSGRLSYQLCYMPLPDSVRDMTGQPVYLIFLFDPETTSNSLARFMELAYGLSKTESRLAAHVCGGLSVEEYAAQENVSVATARTQLRSIYKRTKTKGQARLAILVRGLELLNFPENLEKSKKKKFRGQRDEGLALAELMLSQKPSGNDDAA